MFGRAYVCTVFISDVFTWSKEVKSIYVGVYLLYVYTYMFSIYIIYVYIYDRVHKYM